MLHIGLDFIALPVVFALCAYFIIRRSAARLRVLRDDKPEGCCDSCPAKNECGRLSCELADTKK